MTFTQLMKNYDLHTPEALAERAGLPVKTVKTLWFGTDRIDLNKLSQTSYMKAISESLRCPTATLITSYYETLYGGFVYVMEARDIQKIGRSNDPNKRHKTLQLEYPPLRLVHAIYTNSASILERRIHTWFGEFRLVGEWFRLPDEEILALRSIKSVRYKIWKDD